jgi:hypothetical protein
MILISFLTAEERETGQLTSKVTSVQKHVFEVKGTDDGSDGRPALEG